MAIVVYKYDDQGKGLKRFNTKGECLVAKIIFIG